VLDAAIAAPRTPTLATIATQAQTSVFLLRKALPERCRELSGRVHRRAAEVETARRAATRAEVMDAVATLARDGTFPSIQLVAGRLREPNLLRTPYARQAYWDARRQTPWPVSRRGGKVA
jgi:hypothetical protein